MVISTKECVARSIRQLARRKRDTPMRIDVWNEAGVSLREPAFHISVYYAIR